jgi:hypothetical protein
VTLRLPAGDTISGATGAAYRQDGTTVTFTPAAGTAVVPAKAEVQFQFTVHTGRSGGQPTDCTINGNPCST